MPSRAGGGVLAVRAETPAGAPEPLFSHPERIRYDGHCLQIEGRDFFLSAAAFHYCRTPQELWRDRFQKIKDAGFNTVETYIPWDWHERDLPAGLDDFSKVDLSEFEAWLKMAHEEFGLYAIVGTGSALQIVDAGVSALPRRFYRIVVTR